MEAACTVAASHMEAVSCTVVAIPVHSASRLQSHTFSGLLLPATALGTDSTNRTSVQLSALIASIILCTQFSDGLMGDIPQFFHDILANPALFPKLRVSTTLLPIFDTRMESPAYGFRSLGYFSSYNSSFTSIHIRAIDANPVWNLPEVVAWKSHLLSLETRLDRHFILVLSDYEDKIMTTDRLPHPERFTSPSFLDSSCPSTSSSMDPVPNFNLDDPRLYLLDDCMFHLSRLSVVTN